MTSKWMKWTLIAAASYNIVWGGWVVLFPQNAFELAGMASPRYPEIWQCVGMIVGVYGVGYAIAASNPIRHWPIVLVGLLGKILGPIGFVDAALRGTLPWSLGWTIVTNDLIWWLPFGAILLAARRKSRKETRVDELGGGTGERRIGA
jgi:small multidrug resistance pump